MKRRTSGDQFFVGVTRAAAETIDGLKPYKGGNDPLWWLHALNNIDKHRMVVAVGGSAASIDFGFADDMLASLRGTNSFPDHVRNRLIEATEKLSEQPLYYKFADPIFPVKDGDIFLSGPPGGSFNRGVKLKIYVAVGEPSVLPPTPLDQLVHSISSTVLTLLNELKPHLA